MRSAMGYHKRLQKLEAARLAVNRNLKGSTIAPSDVTAALTFDRY